MSEGDANPKRAESDTNPPAPNQDDAKTSISRADKSQPNARRKCRAASQQKGGRLEYIAICVAGLAFLASAFAAGFSGWQAWIASDTEQRQLRAYLYVLPGTDTVALHPDGSIHITVKPSLKVFGQTPAGAVLPSWNLQIAKYPAPDDILFAVGYGNATVIVNPGAEPVAIYEQSLDISSSDASELKVGKKHVYQGGMILYKDIFGNIRYAEFCRSADFTGLWDNAWELCPIHNGADWYSNFKKTSVIVPPG